MKIPTLLLYAVTSVILSLIAFAAVAADYPAPNAGDWVARDFRFHTGEILPELRLHYTTVGAPSGQPVVILHGTGQSSISLLTPAFAGELFGPGKLWMQASTSSSSRTPWVTESRPSRPTACGQRFHGTTMTIWLWRNTGW